MDTTVIIGIAAGGAALVIVGLVFVLVLLAIVLRKWKGAKRSKAKRKKVRKVVDKRSDSFILHKMNRLVFTDKV